MIDFTAFPQKIVDTSNPRACGLWLNTGHILHIESRATLNRLTSQLPPELRPAPGESTQDLLELLCGLKPPLRCTWNLRAGKDSVHYEVQLREDRDHANP